MKSEQNESKPEQTASPLSPETHAVVVSSLKRRMSELSEEHWAAGWMDGTEFHLWDAVQGKITKWGMGYLEPAKIEGLRRLSNLLGGWILRQENGPDRFVTFEEWEPLYARWCEEETGGELPT